MKEYLDSDADGMGICHAPVPCIVSFAVLDVPDWGR